MTLYKKLKPINNLVSESDIGDYKYFSNNEGKDLKIEKLNLLLHSCCGPCSTSVIEKLIRNYKITVFFYNPNITDKDEYEKRKESQLKFIDEYNLKTDKIDRISFLEGPYDTERFIELSKELKEAKEGGLRCTECFKFRLEKTAETAKMTGNDCFATTLTVSPHKNYLLINKIGMDLALKYNLTYLVEDFKKKAGYQRSIELSKEYCLYRQQFCGCEYSK